MDFGAGQKTQRYNTYKYIFGYLHSFICISQETVAGSIIL